MEVIVIGAGTTGLLLAQGLKKAGLGVTVYERETPEMYSDRPREWGMSLHYGSEAIIKVLPPELRERNKETWCDPFYTEIGYELPIYNGQSGEMIGRTPGLSMRVSRRKMRKLFSEGIDIQLGKKLLNIDKVGDKVKVTFEDGTSATGDLVVGCDGANSRVREHLVGKEAAILSKWDISLLNFTCHFDADTARLIRAKHRIVINSFHPRNRMFMVSIQDVPDPEKPETWLFQVLASWRGSPTVEDFADQRARTAYLQSWAEGYAEPWRTIIKKIPDDVKFGVDDITYWKPIDWSSSPLAGYVTLAGDAAHAMPPYRGQGLNVGLEDAAKLTDELPLVGTTNTTRLPEAIARYEEDMVARVLQEFPITEFAAEIAHDFQRVHHPFFRLGLKKSREEDKKPT